MTVSISGQQSRRLRIWDITQGYRPTSIPGAIAIMPGMRPSAASGGPILPTLSPGVTLMLESLMPGARPAVGEPIVAFSPDGRRLLTASGTSARLWDSATGNPVTPSLIQLTGIQFGGFDADGRRVMLVGGDRTVRVWDASSGEPTTPLISPPYRELPLSWAGFREGDGAVVVGGMVNLVVNPSLLPSPQAPSKAEPFLEREHEWLRNLWHATISRDGRRAVLRGYDHVRVWNIDTGEPVGPLLAQGGFALHADFGADNRRLVTAGSDGLARVWDLTEGDVELSPLCWRPELSAGRSPSYVPMGPTQCPGVGHQLEIFTVALASDDHVATDTLDELGQLLIAGALDDQGGVSPLGGRRLADIRRELAEKRSWRFTPTGEDVNRWHERQAYEAELYGRWEAVETHLEPSMEKRPDGWDLLVRRARARAIRGDYESAGADLRHARSQAEAPVRDWLEYQSDAESLAKNGPMASFYLGALIELVGARPDLLGRRGDALGEISKWREAAADYGRAAAIEGAASEFAVAQAAALLAAEDKDAYRAACAMLVTRFRGTKDPVLADGVARVCSLDKSSGIEPAVLSGLAESTLAVANDLKGPGMQSRLARFLATRGAVYGYAGDHEAAERAFGVAARFDWSVFLLLNRAINLIERGRATEAEAQFRLATRTSSAAPDARREDRPSEFVLARRARELLEARGLLKPGPDIMAP